MKILFALFALVSSLAGFSQYTITSQQGATLRFSRITNLKDADSKPQNEFYLDEPALWWLLTDPASPFRPKISAWIAEEIRRQGGGAADSTTIKIKGFLWEDTATKETLVRDPRFDFFKGTFSTIENVNKMGFKPPAMILFGPDKRYRVYKVLLPNGNWKTI